MTDVEKRASQFIKGEWYHFKDSTVGQYIKFSHADNNGGYNCIYYTMCIGMHKNILICGRGYWANSDAEKYALAKGPVNIKAVFPDLFEDEVTTQSKIKVNMIPVRGLNN